DAEGRIPWLGREDETVRLAPLLRPRPHPIVWAASRRLACSRDLAGRLQRLVPGLRVCPVRPPDGEKPHGFRVPPPPGLAPSEPLRVLLLGQFIRHKGSDTVGAVAAETAARQLPLEFHALGGWGYPVPADDQAGGTLHYYGRFE